MTDFPIRKCLFFLIIFLLYSSINQFNFAGSSGFVVPSFDRIIKTQEGEPALAGNRLDPVRLLACLRLGRNRDRRIRRRLRSFCRASSLWSGMASGSVIFLTYLFRPSHSIEPLRKDVLHYGGHVEAHHPFRCNGIRAFHVVV